MLGFSIHFRILNDRSKIKVCTDRTSNSVRSSAKVFRNGPRKGLLL